MKVTLNGMTFEGTPEEIDAVVQKYRMQWAQPDSGAQRVGRSSVDCNHDFPVIWHGVIPPVCSKCGLQPFTATYAGAST